MITKIYNAQNAFLKRKPSPKETNVMLNNLIIWDRHNRITGTKSHFIFPQVLKKVPNNTPTLKEIFYT
jgi:hypothetical protein